MTIFDNMPRTGLPPHLDGWAGWRQTVDLLSELEIIEDGTKIWWDLRPSDTFPTLETRICDVCPSIDDTLTLAALVQAIMRALWRLRRANRSWAALRPVPARGRIAGVPCDTARRAP